MLWFSSVHPYSIGVEMAGDHVQLAQLGRKGQQLYLLAGDSMYLPESIEPGSVDWQRWAIKALRSAVQKGMYKGRNVAAVAGAGEVIIKHIKASGVSEKEIDEYIFSKLEHRLKLTKSDSIIKYIRGNKDNLVVLVSSREKIDRQVAVYEQSGLQVQSVTVWPLALTESYVNFFSRRNSDAQTVAMLIDMEPDRTNVVICRQRDVLFAHSIDGGINDFAEKSKTEKLLSELSVCKDQFYSMYEGTYIQRLLFFSCQLLSPENCLLISRHLQMASHLGDCLGAVEMDKGVSLRIDRRQSRYSWATVFGLSLGFKK